MLRLGVLFLQGGPVFTFSPSAPTAVRRIWGLCHPAQVRCGVADSGLPWRERAAGAGCDHPSVHLSTPPPSLLHLGIQVCLRSYEAFAPPALARRGLRLDHRHPARLQPALTCHQLLERGERQRGLLSAAQPGPTAQGIYKGRAHLHCSCLPLLLCPQVLFPAKRWHQMLLEEGEDVFAGEEEAVAAT